MVRSLMKMSILFACLLCKACDESGGRDDRIAYTFDNLDGEECYCTESCDCQCPSPQVGFEICGEAQASAVIEEVVDAVQSGDVFFDIEELKASAARCPGSCVPGDKSCSGERSYSICAIPVVAEGTEVVEEGLCFTFASIDCGEGEVCQGGECVVQEEPSDAFDCGNGQQIPADWRCDGIADCGNTSDESDCSSAAGCQGGQFDCGGGNCIDGSWVCDVYEDCPDGSDEAGCGGGNSGCDGFECWDGQCIGEDWVCDGIEDCNTGEDESGCGGGPAGCEGFECSDGTCLEATWECDGIQDCADGSDEEYCW